MCAKMKPPKGGVAIRMYRQGLGDCFLLGFNGKTNVHYMMIDCGVILGTSDAENIMAKIANDIKDTTGGYIDVLVATHEHWDHLSGFAQAQNILDSLSVGEVWLAWTEDPKNDLAKELKKRKKRVENALMYAMQQLSNAQQNGQISAFGERILSLQAFYGDLLGAKGRKTTADALSNVQKGRLVKYCYPGMDALRLKDVNDMRVYILGPPQDPKLIKKSRPSSKPGEVYLDDLLTDRYNAYISELLMRANIASSDEELSIRQPFDSRYIIKSSEASVKGMADRYSEEEWRKIDNNWLELSGELALQLDSHTNNTCLVMAIELSASGKVLLFPGDAQVGSWKSWKDVKWSINGEEITGNDLLRRTILYKVGHHGSHNATLQNEGLELMTDDGLIAMLPVDEKMARSKDWSMPHVPLYDRLKEKTHGRILRVDKSIPEKPGEDSTDSEWKKFKRKAKEEELYFELKISSIQ